MNFAIHGVLEPIPCGYGGMTIYETLSKIYEISELNGNHKTFDLIRGSIIYL